MSYANNTSVSVEKSRAEIEYTLQKYGASRFMCGCDVDRAVICFEAHGKMVKFELPLPDRKDRKFWVTPARYHQRTPEEAFREWEQACRSRWRALLLSIKAKLESVEIGITTFESEFLAHFVMPDGKTLGQTVIPQLEAASKEGKMPRLQLGNS